MLGKIQIDSYQRIAEATLDLTESNVHVFSGDNESGKSSLLEAIAFAIRGLSPRVKLKGQYDELIFNGKKNGSVYLSLDGFDVHRAIKGGKLTTTAPLDFPDLLVDLQLGRERCGRADEKMLRKMLMTVFDLSSGTEYVTHRLKNKGIDDVIIKQCVPLLAAGGFSAAHESAENKKTELRGSWKEVAGEVYGSEKAKDWKPADILNFPEIPDTMIAELREQSAQLKKLRDAKQTEVGALDNASRRAESLNITETAEDLQAALDLTRKLQKEAMDDVTAERGRMESEVNTCNVEIDAIKSKIESAKMAVATLECPSCAQSLVLHTEDKHVRLVSAEAPRRDGPSLDSLIAELNDTQEVKTGSINARSNRIRELEQRFNDKMKEAARLEEKLTLVKSGATKVTPEQVIAAQRAAETSESEYQQALSKLDKATRGKEERAIRNRKTVRAKQYALELEQWSTVAEALGNSADSIPSELLKKTIVPINDRLIAISKEMGMQPIVLDPSMHLSRGDGTPYYMLSESAQWKADACMQLALATFSKLKLVAIDRFDVLAPAHRPKFFEMLSWYAATYTDITVLCMGTLKAKPDLGEGIKSWWVEDGQIS